MNRDAFESWIWRMVESLEDSSVESLSDATLQAYQTRTLSAADRDRVDHTLACSSDHRRRLIALAGDRVTQPPEEVWEKLRFQFTDRRGKRKGTWLRSPFAIAALAATVLLSIAIWLWPGALWPGATQSSEFQMARFEVQLEGASEVRSEVNQGPILMDQVVRLRIESLTPAINGLQYALYREDAGDLIRVPQERFERIETVRGAAWIDVKVDRIAPQGEGLSTLYVVVGSLTPWPDLVELKSGDREQELANATLGKVYALPLDVRSTSDSMAD